MTHRQEGWALVATCSVLTIFNLVMAFHTANEALQVIYAMAAGYFGCQTGRIIYFQVTE